MGNKIDLTETRACNSKLTIMRGFLLKINNFCRCIYFLRIALLVSDVQTL